MTAQPPLPPARLALAGAGQLGRCMARLLHEQAGLQVAGVMTRSLASAQAAVEFIGAGRAVDVARDLAGFDYLLLATPDDALSATCESLAQTGLFRPGQVVFHCSGALGSEVLHAARLAGASIASVHPIRSFAKADSVLRDFAGTWCGMEGEPQALSQLIPLFELLGARLVKIDAANKTLYHAAAVFASNYLVTLADAALAAYEGAGVDRQQGLQMLAPLMRNTLENLLRHGPQAALSGPAARGDLQTLARQQAALQALDPGLGGIYAALAERTLRMSRNADSRDATSAQH